MSTLSGIEFPGHGDPIFRDDWVKEQSEKNNEIINRDLDVNKHGVQSGGTISAGTGSTVNLVEDTVAYDAGGLRIAVPATSAIPVLAGTSTVVLRHLFLETQYAAPENAIKAVTHRDNGYEIVVRSGALETGDVALAEVDSDGTAITAVRDRRTWRICAAQERRIATLEERSNNPVPFAPGMTLPAAGTYIQTPEGFSWNGSTKPVLFRVTAVGAGQVVDNSGEPGDDLDNALGSGWLEPMSYLDSRSNLSDLSNIQQARRNLDVLDFNSTMVKIYESINEAAFVSDWQELSVLYGTNGTPWDYYNHHGVRQTISTGLAFRYQQHGQFLEVKGKINARNNVHNDGVIAMLPSWLANSVKQTIFIPIFFGGLNSDDFCQKTLLLKIGIDIRIAGTDAIPNLTGFFHGIVRLQSGYPGIGY